MATPTATSPIAAAPNAAPDLARLKRYFTESEQLTQEARKNSLCALDYYDSDQFTREELVKLNERGQPAIVINRIKPAINGIIGVTERGRSDPRALPRNPGNEEAADAATDVLRYIADFNRFKRVKQDCFRDMLVPGSMAALVGVDGDLQVTITQIRWEEFFYDARARRPDFKDARYLGIAKWMYADDATALYPDKGREIELTIENGAGGGIIPDQSFQDRPLNGPGTGGAWIDPKMRRLLVIEMYYQDGGVEAVRVHRRRRAGGRPLAVSGSQGPPGLSDRGHERLRQARQRPLWRGVGHDRPAGRDQQAPLQERAPAFREPDRGQGFR